MFSSLLAILAFARTAAADEPQARADNVELRHDLRVDLPLTLGMVGGLIAYTTLARDEVLPATCRWCDGPRTESVNAIDAFFRDALVRPDTHPAGITSHVVSYAFAPVATTALLAVAEIDAGRLKNLGVDALLVAEATLTAVSVSEVIKALTLRERPNVHAEVEEEAHAVAAARSGSNHSFPSGHTLAVFALASSAGTIAAMRDYRLAPLFWIAGSMMGLAAGYLRIAADQHYFTDTLAGAALGVGVGAAVPAIFHRPTGRPSWTDRAALMSAPVRGGRVLSLTVPF